MKRLDELDALRLVAAICVIALHVPAPVFDESSHWDLVRILSRWAVPFFFLLSGFMLPAQIGTAQFTRLAVILIWANLLYLPLFLLRGKLGETGPAILLTGTHFHLWFLSALMLGLGGLALIDAMRQRRAVPDRWIDLLMLAGLLLVVAADLWNANVSGARAREPFVLMRLLSALPCLWFGRRLRDLPLNARHGIWALGIGIALVLIELAAMPGARARFNLQMPLGAFLMAAGLVQLGRHRARPTFAPVLSWLARAGRHHALTLYILHPALLLGLEPLLAGQSPVLWLVLTGSGALAASHLLLWLRHEAARLQARAPAGISSI